MVIERKWIPWENMNTPLLWVNNLEVKMNTPVWRGLAQTGGFNSIKTRYLFQSNCLICLPDKSGNFLVFGPEIARNTLKQAKTGFGMAIIARPGPVFCVFRPKIPRTFYFKLTEQSSRKKLAVGGFEPKNDMMQWRTKQPFAKLPWLIIEN